MKKLIRAVAMCAAMVSGTSMAWGEELKLLSNLASNGPQVSASLNPFFEALSKDSGGKLTIQFIGPDAVPAFDQFQPVAAGAFDLLYTHPAFHTGTTTLGLAIDAIKADPTARRDSGIFDYLDTEYQKLGLKLIAAPPTGSTGYQILLRKPITDAPSFQGRKIRGTATYHPVIKAFGGTPVVLPPGEIYTSLERGVIDGAAWSLVGVTSNKWYEVAKYMSRPTFGSSSQMLFMNLAKFEALSPDLQKILLDAGKKMELDTIPAIDAVVAKEADVMKANGVAETQFPKADADRLAQLFDEGLWTMAAEKSKAADGLRKLAIEKGLTAAN